MHLRPVAYKATAPLLSYAPKRGAGAVAPAKTRKIMKETGGTMKTKRQAHALSALIYSASSLDKHHTPFRFAPSPLSGAAAELSRYVG